MGTTTKMAIPYPEATGLVKDGWEDMKDIATQVDAKTGLVLLNTTAFSAVASQSISDVFSSSYTNYFIAVDVTGSAGTGLRLRFRASGSDETGANYARFNNYVTPSSGPLRATATAQTTMDLCYLTTTLTTMDAWIFNPNNTKISQVQGLANSWTSTADFEGASFSGVLNNTTAYTGFTLYPQTGTFSGTISTYGVNK